MKSDDIVTPAPTLAIPAVNLTLPALTTSPPVVALRPFHPVTIPIESIFVTSL